MKSLGFILIFAILSFSFGCSKKQKPSDICVLTFEEIHEGLVPTQLVTIYAAIRDYKTINNLMTLHSADGSDAILKMLVEEKLMCQEELFREAGKPYDESGVDFIYLNPKDDTKLQPGTIYIIEKKLLTGRDVLYAITKSGCIVHIENLNCPPSELLGKDILTDLGRDLILKMRK